MRVDLKVGTMAAWKVGLLVALLVVRRVDEWVSQKVEKKDSE